MVAINLLQFLDLSNYFYGPQPSGYTTNGGSISTVRSSSVKAVSTSLSARVSPPVMASSGITAKISSSKAASVSASVSVSNLPPSRYLSAPPSTRSVASSSKASSAVVSVPSSRSASSFGSSAAASSAASSQSRVSSGSASWPQSQSASASVIYIPGCPPITVTPASTTTVTGFSYAAPVYATTVTSTTTIPRTITISETVLSNTTVTVPTAISSYVYTQTAIAVTVIPAGTTVTKPTSAGFTPVLCEPVYNQPLPVTIRSFEIRTQTYPYTATSYVVVYSGSTTSTYAETTSYESTITVTGDFTSISFVSTQVTSTSTRANPTSTVYDACATNNVVSRSPYGGYIDLVTPNPAVDGFSSYLFVGAVDPADCCSQCQSNSTCTGSAYINSALLNCVLFNKSPANEQTCDPSFVGGIFRGNVSTTTAYISNSGCGQLGFDYSL